MPGGHDGARRGSSGRFEGDGVAEGFELADVVSFPLVGIGAAAVVVGAEVVEPGLRIGQQVPDDDQYGSSDGDDGAFFAPAPGEAPVAFAEEGAGLADGYRRFAQGPGQVAVAVSGGSPAPRPAGG